MAQPVFRHLLPPNWASLVQQWLQEDVPGFDIGGFVVGDKPERAVLYGKSGGVLAGCPFFEEVMKQSGCRVRWMVEEGCSIDAASADGGKVPIAEVEGPCKCILAGERSALNALSRCSGVATAASEAVRAAEEVGWKGMVAGTRKTTPGFRLVEKYGLVVGGAATHRYDLSQMVMLKDNHIMSAGSITSAVRLARRAGGFSIKVEVEAGTLKAAMEAAAAGADVVMLDNFEPGPLREAADSLKKAFPSLTIEASGGITASTMANYMCESVDIISRGGLTQGYSCLDFSLKVLPS
jgi:nicotinate-nucleotide pyrophosphorylase (carboxylating)